MTLEEAIKHAEEVIVEMSYEFQESVALQDHKNAKLCRECAEEHRQLAEWLKDYKRLLEQENVFDKIGAEIEEVSTYDGIYIDRAYVLEIIDKYRGE